MHAYLHAGSRLMETDAVWDEAKVCVELDGRQVHDTHRAFETDRQRDLALAAKGYLTVRLTWGRITGDSARVAADLHTLLANRCSLAPRSPSSPPC
jgi:very-short-patch-repair endonuclease